jgi:hypothetical protein
METVLESQKRYPGVAYDENVQPVGTPPKTLLTGLAVN